MATKKKTSKDETWPKVNVGSHLTVYTYEDGSTKLEWDDEALLRDVRQAILKAESTVPVSKDNQNTLTDHEKTSTVSTTATKSKRKKKNEA